MSEDYPGVFIFALISWLVLAAVALCSKAPEQPPETKKSRRA